MLCDPKSPFWFYWAPRLLILTLLLSVMWMFSLTFLMDDCLDSLENSTLARSLKESQLLTMAHCILFGSAMPMFFEAFLDFVALRLRKEDIDDATFTQFRIRTLLLICSLLVTIVYGGICLFGNDADLRRLPFVYAVSNHTVTITLMSTILLPLMSLRIIPHTMLLFASILHFLAAPLELIHLLSPGHEKLLQISEILLIVSFLLFMVCFSLWARDVWRRYEASEKKSPFKMETTEFICVIYW